jgi:hypothetical protein
MAFGVETRQSACLTAAALKSQLPVLVTKEKSDLVAQMHVVYWRGVKAVSQ